MENAHSALLRQGSLTYAMQMGIWECTDATEKDKNVKERMCAEQWSERSHTVPTFSLPWRSADSALHLRCSQSDKQGTLSAITFMG